MWEGYLTESKHKDSTKAMYRCSNRNNLLGEMLVANTWVDKLSAAHRNYTNRGMLPDSDKAPSSHSDGIFTFSHIYLTSFWHHSIAVHANRSTGTSAVRDSTVSEPNNPGKTPHQSIPDEDPQEEAVCDPTVFAEVKLVAQHSEFSNMSF